MPLDQDIINRLEVSLKDSHRSSPILFGFISSLLASIGLATNSQTTILGAMLLSPITSLINKNNIYHLLRKNNIKVENKYKHWIKPLLIVITVTLIVSYLFGIIFSHVINPFTGERVIEKWPTKEMKERADPLNALYMVIIALLCGLALPMSILTNNSVRFVAIGIATALIPPLANIGISLSYRIDTEDAKKREERNSYRKTAIITGFCIFIINLLLLWIPSKYLLEVFCQSQNRFKRMEKVFETVIPRGTNLVTAVDPTIIKSSPLKGSFGR